MMMMMRGNRLPKRAVRREDLLARAGFERGVIGNPRDDRHAGQTQIDRPGRQRAVEHAVLADRGDGWRCWLAALVRSAVSVIVVVAVRCGGGRRRSAGEARAAAHAHAAERTMPHAALYYMRLPRPSAHFLRPPLQKAQRPPHRARLRARGASSADTPHRTRRRPRRSAAQKRSENH